jgi:anti-sigma factor RsiW
MSDHRRPDWHPDPEELERYVDDALEPARRADVATHLATGASFRAEV